MRDHLVFFVNGVKQVVRDAQPQTTLLQYLRAAGLTGTKLGCGEGGCGACTVMVSTFDAENKKIKHSAVNACLAPVCSVDWCHVTTVEGVGSMRQGLHPVQQRIAEMHGSQCGFCTPGVVMALYALLRSNPSASSAEIEEGLDGNLCRCTGYRPILDAAKSLGVDGGRPARCCRGGGGGGDGGGGCPCFDSKTATEPPTSSSSSAASAASVDKDQGLSETFGLLSTEPPTAPKDGSNVTPAAPPTPSSAASANGVETNGDGKCCQKKQEKRECTASRAREPRFSERYRESSTSTSEPVFPAALMLAKPSAVSVVGETATWHCPTSLADLLRLKAAHPEARIVAGNTRVGIEVKFEGVHYPVLISPSRVPELHSISITPATSTHEGGVLIGGAAPLSSVEHALAEIDGRGSSAGGVGGGGAAGACVDMLRWFGSTQIRNVACLAGSLATASPASDMNPLLAACGADVVLSSVRGGERKVKVRDFFLGHREVAMEADEVIVAVFLPTAAGRSGTSPLSTAVGGRGDDAEPSAQYPRSFEFVRPFKQARRRELDVSIVTAGMRVVLEARGGKWVVKEAALCFGGMAPTTVAAPLTEGYLVGKEWSGQVLDGAYDLLSQDLPLSQNAPGGQCEYRRALPPSFLFKFFVEVSIQLEQALSSSLGPDGDLPPAPIIGDSDRSAATSFVTAPKQPSRGQQEYTPRTGGMQKARPIVHAPATGTTNGGTSTSTSAVDGGVGENLVHRSADLQVTGEAVYIDDIPSPAGTLFAGLVLSTKPHAKLVEVDASAALGAAGVVRFLGAGDLATKRNNRIGVVKMDEELFAADEVHCVGQVIGAVLAESSEIAEKAAKLVTVRYEELPAVMTIEDAIAAESYFPGGHTIVDGDPDAALAGAGVVTVEGELTIGGQEHFYLETNATLAVPGEAGSLEILASTQNPTMTQSICAKVCGVDKNKVVCRTKRMGGGFGGKETRSVFLSGVAALAAHITRRPVRINLDRDVDMQITGHRHAFLAKYKAGGTKDGKLVGMDVKLYNNAGCSLDLSPSVMDKALFQIDNCYRWPALRAEGLVCKTNQNSHTAFRGFGGPQSMLVTETMMDHIAKALGMDPFVLRTQNLYKAEEPMHFGQLVDDWNIPEAWSDVQRWAEIGRRRREVDEFNVANRYRKRGLAVIPSKFGISFSAGFLDQGGALVHVYLDGTVLVSHGGTEMGQGLHTKVCQVVANEFGIDVDKVHIAETATDKVINSSPTAASVSTDLYGMAALDACEQITERLKPVIGGLPEGSPFSAVVTAAYFQRINLSAQGFYSVPAKCEYDFDMDTDNNSDRGRPFNYLTQGVAASEVEVDCLTGDVKLLRVDILMDIGTSINPAIDIGQIEGAFMQGYGWCTMEETSWGDSEHPWIEAGHLFTKGPGTYKIPSSDDVPADMRIKLMDRANALAIHSSKAVGEPPFFMASSAFFAIKDAVASARKDHGEPAFFRLNSPASSERIRTACLDGFMEGSAAGGADADVSAKDFQAKGSW